MPPISVVVPIYQVKHYLAECLTSIAGQTMDDLEVVMVDDGSTDGSAAIADEFAAADRRFRLISQPNGGLGSARNTGIDASTGRYLAFVDSDDTLPPDAYERLLASLESTGSDFASGNVLRVSGTTATQAGFLSRAFATTRRRTHVTRFPELLADRTAWNKLWRRSFWDHHALRFPEGVVHEDIPVVLPAHFKAASVDVLAAPVYRYRVRDDGERSITQRRLEHHVLRDRLDAIEQVAAYLDSSRHRGAKGWYLASVVRDDLRLHLDLLDDADDAYRALFLERVSELVHGVDPRVYERLPAIDRLKWHLIHRGLLPELLEVVRFHKEEADRTPPVRRGLRHYGDYPFRTDERLAIPRSVFRLGRRDDELALTARLEELRCDGDTLTVRGRAHITCLGAPSRRSQSVRIGALRPGRWRRIRMRLAPLRLRTCSRQCPDAPDAVAWSGFEATLDVGALRGQDGWEDATWEVYAFVRAGLVRRRRARFVLDPAPAPAVGLVAPEQIAVGAAAADDGRLTLRVRRCWAAVGGHELVDGRHLVLTGHARLARGPATLELVRRVDGTTLTYPLTVRGHRTVTRLSATVVLSELGAAARRTDDEWELWAVSGADRVRVTLPAGTPAVSWRCVDCDLTLSAATSGDAILAARPRQRLPLPVAAPHAVRRTAGTPT
jgi:CDP-glycerol glycerophosphotransferase